MALRGGFQGTQQILRYNWRLYAVGIAVCLGGLLALQLHFWPSAVRLLLALGFAITAFWVVLSVLVSYYVYDYSELCGWLWIADFLSRPPRRWANFHAGLDEASHVLQELFPSTIGSVLDIYDGSAMTEASIKRARELSLNTSDVQQVDFRNLPIPDASWDTLFLLFVAHEIRNPALRLQFFLELQRTLEPRGFVVLVEHVRDIPNFLAFGPGFWHFFPAGEWLRVTRAAGFTIAAERRITPFVRAYLLQRL